MIKDIRNISTVKAEYNTQEFPDELREAKAKALENVSTYTREYVDKVSASTGKMRIINAVILVLNHVQEKMNNPAITEDSFDYNSCGQYDEGFYAQLLDMHRANLEVVCLHVNTVIKDRKYDFFNQVNYTNTAQQLIQEMEAVRAILKMEGNVFFWDLQKQAIFMGIYNMDPQNSLKFLTDNYLKNYLLNQKFTAKSYKSQIKILNAVLLAIDVTQVKINTDNGTFFNDENKYGQFDQVYFDELFKKHYDYLGSICLHMDQRVSLSKRIWQTVTSNIVYSELATIFRETVFNQRQEIIHDMKSAQEQFFTYSYESNKNLTKEVTVNNITGVESRQYLYKVNLGHIAVGNMYFRLSAKNCTAVEIGKGTYGTVTRSKNFTNSLLKKYDKRYVEKHIQKNNIPRYVEECVNRFNQLIMLVKDNDIKSFIIPIIKSVNMVEQKVTMLLTDGGITLDHNKANIAASAWQQVLRDFNIYWNNNFFHGDIKLKNITYDATDKMVKVIDFDVYKPYTLKYLPKCIMDYLQDQDLSKSKNIILKDKKIRIFADKFALLITLIGTYMDKAKFDKYLQPRIQGNHKLFDEFIISPGARDILGIVFDSDSVTIVLNFLQQSNALLAASLLLLEQIPDINFGDLKLKSIA